MSNQLQNRQFGFLRRRSQLLHLHEIGKLLDQRIQTDIFYQKLLTKLTISFYSRDWVTLKFVETYTYRLFQLSVRKERKEEFVQGILLASAGPISVKNLQNLLAISQWSIIIFPPDMNVEGKDGLVFRLLITWFTSLHIC